MLLNHHTLWLPTQFSSVFFFCCSFLNDFPFLALVVKPVIYLSQRRRKNERKSFFIFYSLCSVFAFSKRLLEMTKGRMYLTMKKEGETCNIEVPVFSIFHGVLLCLDTFRCNYIENSWNILNIRKQTPNLTTTSTSIWCSLHFRRFFVCAV